MQHGICTYCISNIPLNAIYGFLNQAVELNYNQKMALLMHCKAYACRTDANNQLSKLIISLQFKKNLKLEKIPSNI